MSMRTVRTVLLNQPTIFFCVIIIISTSWLSTGALELEGVEVQVQLDDKKDIKDLIPKKVNDNNYSQTSSYLNPQIMDS